MRYTVTAYLDLDVTDEAALIEAARDDYPLTEADEHYVPPSLEWALSSAVARGLRDILGRPYWPDPGASAVGVWVPGDIDSVRPSGGG